MHATIGPSHFPSHHLTSTLRISNLPLYAPPNPSLFSRHAKPTQIIDEVLLHETEKMVLFIFSVTRKHVYGNHLI